MKIPVLYEDQWLLAVNKPPALPVHKTVDATRPHLQAYVEAQAGQPLVLFHRLDLDTTGVVLFGKDPAVNEAITSAFRGRLMKKTYWAVVDGRWLPEWTEVRSFIAKKPGGKWANVVRQGDDAHSLFRLIASSGERSLVEVKPQTGRTHQIRLHCEKMQHPILGDPLYGRKDPRGLPIALHALRLEFTHPLEQKPIKIEAPLPDYWKKEWLKGLGEIPV